MKIYIFIHILYQLEEIRSMEKKVISKVENNVQRLPDHQNIKAKKRVARLDDEVYNRKSHEINEIISEMKFILVCY